MRAPTPHCLTCGHAPGILTWRIGLPGERLPRSTRGSASCRRGSRRRRRRLRGWPPPRRGPTGTADAAAEAISAGLANPGDLMVMYGSSIFFIRKNGPAVQQPAFRATRFLEPIPARRRRRHCPPDGSLTRWFPITLPRGSGSRIGRRENAYAVLAELAAASPPGARGLVALPYFAGERTPIFDPHAKGLLVGLTLSQPRAATSHRAAGIGRLRHPAQSRRYARRRDGACPYPGRRGWDAQSRLDADGQRHRGD